MKPIDEATEILKKKNDFVIIADNGENGLDLRIRYSYKTGLSMIAAIADIMMEDFVPEYGYTVHEDIKAVIEKTISLSKAVPDEAVQKKSLDALQNLMSKLTTDKSPAQYFNDLRNGEE